MIETISESQPDDTHRDPRHANDAAAAVAALLAGAQERGLRCHGIVASGGHLASVLVDVLGAQRLSVSGEVAPLCAHGMIAGGPWSGLTIVTKGGLVGDDDTLSALVDYLWKEH
jgi:uncharacterized protein YgbK (DUF1537 family)